MLQQNLYNENNRYIKWLTKNKVQFVDLDLIIVAILLIEAFVMFDVEKFSLIMLIVLICASVIEICISTNFLKIIIKYF